MTTSEAPKWLDAWRGVLFAQAKVVRTVERELAERFDLPLTWFDVLSRLSSAPNGRMRMQELAENALFTRSGVTRLIDRIEEAGLVRRERTPADRRGVYVVLTDAGAQRFNEAFHGHLPVIQREFSDRLTMQEHRAIADALWPFWHTDEVEQSEQSA